MAASCCAATSTRFVASSSCRARKTRTLAMKNPPTIGSALAHYSSSSSSSSSGNRRCMTAPAVWTVSPRSVYASSSSPRSSSSLSVSSLRKFASNSPLRSQPHQQQQHRSRTGVAAAAVAVEPVLLETSSTALSSAAPSGGTQLLGYLRRHACLSLEDLQAHSGSRNKQLSVVMAFALCFLASVSTTSTTSSNDPSVKLSSSGGGGGGGGGLKPSKTKPTFMFSKLQAEKDVAKLQEDAAENPYLVSEGIFQGARWTMEDTYKVENGGRFLAVFDGHGGAEVSSVLQERLYELYSEELVKKHWEQQNDFNTQRKIVPSKSCHIAALQRGLEQVEEAIMKLDELVYQGSTAVCCVLHVAKDGRRTLLTANVGDSRAILCRDGKALDMTRDHKPGDDTERKRIQAMGEEIEWDPYGQVYRVRDLSLSRAIGDRFAKPVVTSEAEIMTFPVVEETDQFVLLASDGLWDVMTSQEVVDYVQEILSAESQVFSQLDKRKEMARIVANEALERGSADNVCVLVLWLNND